MMDDEQRQEFWGVQFTFRRTLVDSHMVTMPMGLSPHDREMYVRGFLAALYNLTPREKASLEIMSMRQDEYE